MKTIAAMLTLGVACWAFGTQAQTFDTRLLTVRCVCFAGTLSRMPPHHRLRGTAGAAGRGASGRKISVSELIRCDGGVLAPASETELERMRDNALREILTEEQLLQYYRYEALPAAYARGAKPRRSVSKQLQLTYMELKYVNNAFFVIEQETQAAKKFWRGNPAEARDRIRSAYEREIRAAPRPRAESDRQTNACGAGRELTDYAPADACRKVIVRDLRFTGPSFGTVFFLSKIDLLRPGLPEARHHTDRNPFRAGNAAEQMIRHSGLDPGTGGNPRTPAVPKYSHATGSSARGSSYPQRFIGRNVRPPVLGILYVPLRVPVPNIDEQFRCGARSPATRRIGRINAEKTFGCGCGDVAPAEPGVPAPRRVCIRAGAVQTDRPLPETAAGAPTVCSVTRRKKGSRHAVAVRMSGDDLHAGISVQQRQQGGTVAVMLRIGGIAGFAGERVPERQRRVFFRDVGRGRARAMRAVPHRNRCRKHRVFRPENGCYPVRCNVRALG